MKEILTPREAAEYLSVHVRTIYRLAKGGEIPCRKVGGSWRFKKEALDEWLSWGKSGIGRQQADVQVQTEETAQALKSGKEWRIA